MIVVTISEEGSHSRSFSADTGMAECLFIARKERLPPKAERRATFVILNHQPSDTLEGEQVAQAISKALAAGGIRRLEDGPFGGTRILLGCSLQGEAVDCPLPAEAAWQMVGIKDVTVGQTAHQLARGRLWIEGMAGDAIDIPITTISKLIRRIGHHHLDICGAQVKSDGFPQGPFEHIGGVPAGAGYPCLWNHDTRRERRLIVEPDSHCRVRSLGGVTPPELLGRAAARWDAASRAHYNLDLQFNSQSIIVAITTSPSIGGRAWPTIVLADQAHDFAFSLWTN
jgi:hypothetical protein